MQNILPLRWWPDQIASPWGHGQCDGQFTPHVNAVPLQERAGVNELLMPPRTHFQYHAIWCSVFWKSSACTTFSAFQCILNSNEWAAGKHTRSSVTLPWGQNRDSPSVCSCTHFWSSLFPWKELWSLRPVESASAGHRQNMAPGLDTSPLPSLYKASGLQDLIQNFPIPEKTTNPVFSTQNRNILEPLNLHKWEPWMTP